MVGESAIATLRRTLNIVLGVTCLLFVQQVKAQNQQVDTLARVHVSNYEWLSEKEVQFDVWIHNVSDNVWDRWANITVQYNIPSIPIEECTVSRIPDSGHPLLEPNQQLYQFVHRTFPGRLSIGVLGPDEYFDCIEIAPGDSVSLGRFVLSAPGNVNIPVELDMVYPLEKYQAHAFKAPEENNPWSRPQDNLSMPTIYTIDIDRPDMEFIEFFASYMGDLQILLEWETLSELNNRGFVMERGIRPFGDPAGDNTNVVFDTLVSYDPASSYYDPTFPAAHGTTSEPHEYQFVDNNNLIRGEEYVYRLSYEEYSGRDSILAWDDAIVASAVIVRSSAKPNPFSTTTELSFTLDDRVILGVKVFDVEGKLVEVLLEEQELPIGEHTLVWNAKPFAQQGAYLIRFFAKPVDDAFVEFSTNDLKVQLVR